MASPTYTPPPVAGASGGQPQAFPRDQGGYKGKRPVVAFFHAIFKIVAVLTFIVGWLIGGSYVAVFIITTLALSADFWVTKNVTGRLMVRLRWWNRVTEDGESEWIFESHPDADKVDGFDSYFFWLVSYINVGVWILFIVFNIMSFSRLPLCVLGIALSGSNTMGYFKCSRDQKTKLTKLATSAALRNPGVVAHAARAAA